MSASVVSAPVTVYYVAGALLTAAIASVYERFGRAPVVGPAPPRWPPASRRSDSSITVQLYPVFLVMS